MPPVKKGARLPASAWPPNSAATSTAASTASTRATSTRVAAAVRWTPRRFSATSATTAATASGRMSCGAV